jgi:hypothetical protein
MATVIYPLLVRQFTFLRGPVFYFSDNHYLAQVNETDHGTILRYCPNDYQGLLNSRFRCVYFDADDNVQDDEITTTGQLLAYTLNYFSSLDALDFPFSIALRRVGRRNRATFAPSTTRHLLNTPTNRFRLAQGTGGKDLQKLFSLTKRAAGADPRVKLMIDRFNSALRRDRLEDRIIDLSVALETMVDESTEISFRLSLFLAFVSQQDKATAYEHFKTLYDVRSRIVHGSTHQRRARRAVDDIENRMPEIIKHAKAAMLYFYTYFSQDQPGDWGKHCLGLVLGSEQPIIEGA